MTVIDYKLDETDLAIIEMLIEDASRSNVYLAESLDLSPQTIANRLRRLFSDRVLRIISRLDIRLLGYTGLSLLRIHAPSQALLERMIEVPWILSAASRVTEDSVLFSTCHNDMRTLSSEVYDLIGTYSPESTCSIAECLTVYKYNFNTVMLPDEPPQVDERLFEEAFYQHADKTDFQIVSRLVHDGRMSNRQIGREINLSENVVRKRLAALYDKHLLQTGALVDNNVRYQDHLYFEIELEVPLSRYTDLVERLKAEDRITFLVQTTGSTNLLAGHRFENIAEASQFRKDIEKMACIKTMAPSMGVPEFFRYEYMYVL